ncbi:MAG: hypothetical protein KDA89_10970, partial [Planctomycetaceae bacterium]|nr:hypothetical protein [Planctomycetaceae bacterium]
RSAKAAILTSFRGAIGDIHFQDDPKNDAVARDACADALAEFRDLRSLAVSRSGDPGDNVRNGRLPESALVSRLPERVPTRVVNCRANS